MLVYPPTPAEYPPSCEQERRDAIEEARQHQQEGTFIPECEGDDTYKAVQCHQATGYCWCVRVDTGRPVPGTSTRSVSSSPRPLALTSPPRWRECLAPPGLSVGRRGPGCSPGISRLLLD